MSARIQPGLVLVALFLAATGTACALHDDLDQYPFRAAPSTLDDAGDATNTADDLGDSGPSDLGSDDADTPDDVGPDMAGDTGFPDMDLVDTGPDLDVSDMGGPFGMVCPDIDPEPLSGDCDPVDQIGCPDDFACAVTINTGTDPISFERGCTAVTGLCNSETELCEGEGNESLTCSEDIDCPSIWVREEGETCLADARCKEGLRCVGGVGGTCRKHCELATARGCDPDEYCARITPGTAEIGICVDSC